MNQDQAAQVLISADPECFEGMPAQPEPARINEDGILIFALFDL
jgi:hypothetical protein